MQGQKSGLSIVIIALATSPSIFLPTMTSAAATCQSAPKGPAPQGSHWYYRLDRTLQRKCWHLASQDRDAARDAAPQSRAAAQPPAPPVADTTAEDEAATQEAPDASALTTKSASNVAPDNAAAAPPAAPPADTIAQQSATPVAPAEQVQAPVPPPAVEANSPAPPVAANPSPPVEQAAPQPHPAAAAAPVQAVAGPTSMLQFVFLALAVVGLLGGAIFYIREIRRRRSDVLKLVANANPAPRKLRAVGEQSPAPSLAPSDPGDELQDDIEDVVQQLSAMRRRRAA